jgi:hypothetical protein
MKPFLAPHLQRSGRRLRMATIIKAVAITIWSIALLVFVAGFAMEVEKRRCAAHWGGTFWDQNKGEPQ